MDSSCAIIFCHKLVFPLSIFRPIFLLSLSFQLNLHVPDHADWCYYYFWGGGALRDKMHFWGGKNPKICRKLLIFYHSYLLMGGGGQSHWLGQIPGANAPSCTPLMPPLIIISNIICNLVLTPSTFTPSSPCILLQVLFLELKFFFYCSRENLILGDTW